MRRLAIAVCAASIGLVVAGCGPTGFTGVYDLPLPGGADVGSHPYQVTAQFADVVDLVPQAAVKVNEVAVGRVTRISLPAGGWTARVSMLVNGDVRLPANAIAWLGQTSLLGEKYVELGAPAGQPAIGRLADGAVIPVDRTSRSPEVEEVFGALSMLLNGGGVAQLQSITRQLNSALHGNEPQIRALLTNIDATVADLDAHRTDISAAIDGVNRLSATLAGRDQQIGTVLDDLAPGLGVLDQQRDQLVGMLDALDTLSGVAVRTINASKDDLVADLDALAPTLRRLADAGSTLPHALQVLFTYPFTDAVLPAIRGDYLNVYLSIAAINPTTITPPITPLSGQQRPVVPLTGAGGS